MDLTCDIKLTDSPFIDHVWRGKSEGEGGSFISIANSHWGMVVTRINGQTMMTVRGPETVATSAYSPEGAEFFGVQFKPGTLMPDLPAKMLMDRCDVTLPNASSQSFWLNGAAWQFPDYENIETFIERLIREEVLIHEPVVNAVLQGEQPGDVSLRTVQRRFLQATGLTYGMISQIERARQAAILLKQGMSILDTVEAAGYFDQPHLTRSLKHFIGQTPAQIMNKNRTERLSFLYNTGS